MYYTQKEIQEIADKREKAAIELEGLDPTDPYKYVAAFHAIAKKYKISEANLANTQNKLIFDCIKGK